MKDITVYTFVIPSSAAIRPRRAAPSSRAKGPDRQDLAWMLRAESPPQSTANCDAGLIERNLALANKVWVSFQAGGIVARWQTASRVPGGRGAGRRLRQAMGQSERSGCAGGAADRQQAERLAFAAGLVPLCARDAADLADW